MQSLGDGIKDSVGLKNVRQSKRIRFREGFTTVLTNETAAIPIHDKGNVGERKMIISALLVLFDRSLAATERAAGRFLCEGDSKMVNAV